jgi:hypothetical protein
MREQMHHFSASLLACILNTGRIQYLVQEALLCEFVASFSQANEGCVCGVAVESGEWRVSPTRGEFEN